MKTNDWLPWVIAVAAHAAVGAALIHWTQAEPPLTSADFVAADGPFFVTLETDLTPSQSDICEVHRAQMSRVLVPVLCATEMHPEHSRGVLERITNVPPDAHAAGQFPHSGRPVQGGGCVNDDFYARVYVCQDCKIAEEVWRAARTLSVRR